MGSFNAAVPIAIVIGALMLVPLLLWLLHGEGETGAEPWGGKEW